MKNASNQSLDNIRHSCAHLLAAACLELWPGTQNAIGPSIEDGFYQDFDFGDVKISEDDLPKIEKKMRELLQKWSPFEIKEVSVEQAKKDFAWNKYKLELIEEFGKEGKKITENNPGNFLDLCKGGHSENPQQDLKYFKLLSIAGAYWRGSEKNKMLTRIYGTCFPTQKELDEYLTMLEEAKKRDHKKIGPQLELFFFHETAPGMPYWLPKGVIIYNELLKFWRQEHQKRGYLETASPILNKKQLYITSGHFEHYWEEMFVANMGKDEEYGVKAMNCPNAMTIFSFKTRSYKDLPLRFSDTDSLHRYEKSGVLNGLFRVREFRQDDAHIFVAEDQIEDEYKRLFEIVEKFYAVFDLEYSFRLGKRPEKFMGDPKIWDRAEKLLEEILNKSNKPFVVAEGEGAFYGPKIDILMKDSLGRQWQMGTLQLDFHQPTRFKLKYTDKNGYMQTPIAIHRVVYGSLERFIGILIEHFSGAFPVWLAPVQAMIIPITERNNEYAKKVMGNLENVRVEIDERGETMQAKIRDAQMQKVPFMLIMGDREEKENLVAVRTREGKDLGTMKINEFMLEFSERSKIAG